MNSLEFTWVTADNGQRYQVKVKDLVKPINWDTDVTDTVHIVINFIKKDEANQVHDDIDNDFYDTTNWEIYWKGIQRIVTTACSIEDY